MADAKQRYFIEVCKLDPKLLCVGDKDQHGNTFGDDFPLCFACLK